MPKGFQASGTEDKYYYVVVGVIHYACMNVQIFKEI